VTTCRWTRPCGFTDTTATVAFVGAEVVVSKNHWDTTAVDTENDDKKVIRRFDRSAHTASEPRVRSCGDLNPVACGVVRHESIVAPTRHVRQAVGYPLTRVRVKVS
jgi:hypothetical protein